MPTQIQLRRGTYAQHQSFTGANAEPTFDTTNRVLRIHDASTPGGLEQVGGNTLYKSNPVRVVSTSNITLSGTQTIDGVSLAVGDRVLVTGQSDNTKNGIWVVADLAWSRSFDFDKIGNIQKGMVIYVAEGSTHNETVWKLTSQPTTIELHAITFEKWLGVETRGLAQNTVAGLVVRQSKGTYTSRAITVSGQGISVTNGDGISGNPLLSLNSTPNNTASTIMARDNTGSFVAQNAVLNGNLTVNGIVIDGGSLVGSTTEFNLVSTNALTINFGDVATNIIAGASGSNGTFRIKNDNVLIDGNLTVNGTTTTTNSTVVTIDDPIMTLGGDTAPTSNDAKDRGIEFRYYDTAARLGFMGWDNSQGKFWLLQQATNTGEVYTGTLADLQLRDLAVDGGDITTTQTTFNLVDATATTLNIGRAASTLNIGATSGTATIQNPTVVGTQATQNLWNTVATTVNAFGAAGTLNLGVGVTGVQTTNIATGATATATTKTLNLATGGLTGSTTDINLGSTAGGLLTINNPNVSFNNGIVSFTNTTDATTSANGSVRFAGGISVVKNIVCDGTFSIFGDISVNGGDILTNQTTVSLFNTTATTANLLGSASTITMGASGGTTTLRSGTLVGTDATQNLYNTVATTLNIGGAATAINLGNATSATVTVRPGTVVGANTTQSLYDTVATTVNAFGAATTLTLGNATGATATIRPGTVVGSNATQNLWNTTATTINFGGAATTIEIGAASGTTNINNNLDVDGDVNIDGGDLTVSTTTFNLANTTATTLNVGGAATALNLGASTGNTTVNNNLVVSGNLTVNGTTTTINSTTLSVDDLNIVLADGAASAAAANGAGLTVAGANATILYASTGDRWELNKPLYVSGTGNITGNTSIGGTLGVTGATTLSSTLGVTGATTLSSTLGVSGVTAISNSTASTSTSSGALVVTGGVGIGGATYIGGNISVAGTSAHTGNATFSGTLGVTGAVTLSSSLSAGSTTLSSLTLSTALSISNGGTGATTAQGARTNLLPAQSAGVNGYVLTSNGTDVYWSYLGNAMVTTFNGRTNAVTLTSGDVTGALGYTPLNGGNTSTQTITFGGLEIAAGGMLKGNHGNWTGEHNKIQWHSSHLYFQNYEGGRLAVFRRSNGAEPCVINNDGTVVAAAVQTTSDIKLKENVETIKNASYIISNLRGVTFDWKATKKKSYGFIAQELEQQLPELVIESPDDTLNPNGATTKSVDYDKIVSVLVEGWKEQQARIESLEAEVKALKGE